MRYACIDIAIDAATVTRGIGERLLRLAGSSREPQISLRS